MKEAVAGWSDRGTKSYPGGPSGPPITDPPPFGSVTRIAEGARS